MKSKHTPSKRLLIFIFVLLVFISGVWMWWKDGIRAVDKNDDAPVMFIIQKGETAREVAANLAKQDLIRSPSVFFLLLKIMGIERDIQAGDYRLNKAMNARALAEELTHGIIDVWVTILEGWRVEEVAMQLSKDLDIPEKEFLKQAKEGYMFPDTYLIAKDASSSAVVNILLDTFNQKVTPQMKQDIQSSRLSMDEIVTLASIIEREGRSKEDRPVISGILYNRLEQDWPLQVDATLQYALGYQESDKSWWKSELTNQDKDVDSPYNTYKFTGLPPGPIANPGLLSIQAAIYPERTEFMYYLHDDEGNIHYAETLSGHEANISRYLR